MSTPETVHRHLFKSKWRDVTFSVAVQVQGLQNWTPALSGAHYMHNTQHTAMYIGIHRLITTQPA